MLATQGGVRRGNQMTCHSIRLRLPSPAAAHGGCPPLILDFPEVLGIPAFPICGATIKRTSYSSEGSRATISIE